MKNMAKILCFVLSLVLVFSVIGISTFAEEATALSGSGTEADPFLINTVDELKFFAASVNAGETTYNAKNVWVALGSDLDLENNAWTPIGTKANPFKGIFDGGEHTVSNLYINDAELSNAGLFGYAKDAKINNVNVKNVNITAYYAVGAITGTHYTGSISNCHVSGSISLVATYAYAGGITSNGYVDIYDCSVIAEGMGTILVGEKTMAGGIVGWMGEGANGTFNCTVKNLNITGWTSVGAINGLVHYNNTITGCVAENINLTKTRGGANGAIGLAAGNWVAKSNGDYTTTVTDNSFTGITINGNAAVKGTLLCGSNYSGYDNVNAKLVEDGNTLEEITSNLYIAAYTSADLANAIKYNVEGDVVIELGADITFDYGARMAYGTSETTSLTINGNGYTLTLNQTDSDWGSIGLANADATLIFNDVTIEKVGYGDTNGAWNTHALNITSKLEMNNVKVNQSLCVQKDAVLNNVDINEANGYYGLWITAEGQSVTFNGGSITATNGGRGIKVADQYVDSASSVTLNVSDVTFTTAKKAAILVSSVGGADITATDCDISGVASDSTNIAWVDEDWADSFSEVTVNGGAASQENVESFNITVKTEDGAAIAYYKNLDDLFASDLLDTTDDYTVLLTGDVTASKVVSIHGSQVGWNFVTETQGGVKMTFAYADNWNYVCHMSIGEGITLEAPYLCVYGGVFDVYGTVNTDYLYGMTAAITVKEGATVNVTTNSATVQAKNNTWLEVYGTLNAGTVNVWNSNSRASTLIVSGENATLTANHIHAWDGGSATKANTITVENGATLSAKQLQADRGSEITVDNATVISEGISLGYGDNVGTLTMQNGANLQLNNGGKINVSANSSVAIDDTCTSNAVASVADASGVATYYTSLQDALDVAAAGSGEIVVEIHADVDLTGTDWNPVTVSAPGYPCVTVNGNGHTISGLNDMLFAGTWAGKSGLIINDLTIADSDIQNDVNDTKGTVGVGAFIGYPQASSVITLNNCHLVDSKVSGGHWTGGLIGMAGGYNGNDGPVFMNLTINGCSVVGNTITGKGSVGGVIGHGSCAAWTNVVISDTVVRDNIIISTGDSNVKAGSIMGTIGAAGQPTTANGVTLTGGMSVEATVSGNSVTSNGTVITTIYGRQGSSTGLLEIVGGSYEHYPIEEDVAYANVKEGLRFFKGYDGYYGVVAVSATPEIIDGYWWIGDVNTGMVAEPKIDKIQVGEYWYWTINGVLAKDEEGNPIRFEGDNGVAPKIEAKGDYWYINDIPTGVKAEGADGITIVSVHKDAERSDALVSVYVMTFSNGQEWRFSVTNGLNGDQGLPGIQGPEGPKGPTGDPGLPGADGNDNNQTVIIVISIATVCIIFTLAVVLYRGVGRRSWWCTR